MAIAIENVGPHSNVETICVGSLVLPKQGFQSTFFSFGSKSPLPSFLMPCRAYRLHRNVRRLFSTCEHLCARRDIEPSEITKTSTRHSNKTVKNNNRGIYLFPHRCQVVDRPCLANSCTEFYCDPTFHGSDSVRHKG